MKIAVLGGLGMQGKAALFDLSRSERVHAIVCVDSNQRDWDALARITDTSKITPVTLDASARRPLVELLSQGVDAAIDLLPLPLMPTAFEAAIEAKVPLVSTNYARNVRHLEERARASGVQLLPECGLDPGIDLVIWGHAVRQFDELHVLNSYCGGIPEKSGCTNPLNYKISWNFDMMLGSQKRDSVLIHNGRRLAIPASEQHESEMVHSVDFPGVGALEAIPNGDAVAYTDLLGVTGTVRQAGRYTLRWPGWSAVWAPLKRLGFLSEQMVPGLPCPLSPRQFMVKLLEPQLQFGPDEKDLVLMLNVFEGLKDGRRLRIRSSFTISRDLRSGLFGMALGVGFPASIAAQMLAEGRIAGRGLLNPAVDLPYAPFMEALAERGIVVKEDVLEVITH
jgi:saccharopine dehydrogenase-like NADP-dependent oxidoreductase